MQLSKYQTDIIDRLISEQHSPHKEYSTLCFDTSNTIDAFHGSYSFSVSTFGSDEAIKAIPYTFDTMYPYRSYKHLVIRLVPSSKNEYNRYIGYKVLCYIWLTNKRHDIVNISHSSLYGYVIKCIPCDTKLVWEDFKNQYLRHILGMAYTDDYDKEFLKSMHSELELIDTPDIVGMADTRNESIPNMEVDVRKHDIGTFNVPI